MDWDHSRMCLKPLLCCAVGAPRKGFFPPTTTVSKTLDMATFQKVSFRRKLDFWITYLERYLRKVVHMYYTDHFVFGKRLDLIWTIPSKSEFLRNDNFSKWLCEWIDFIEVVFLYDASSWPLPKPHSHQNKTKQNKQTLHWI